MMIVQINESHINEILRLENQIYTRPWSKNHFLLEITDSANSINIACIAEKGDVRSYIFGKCQAGNYHLTNIAVHPNFRRKKVASKMLDYLFGKLDDLNVKSIFLAIKNENEPARRLFLSKQFYEQNKDKNYYTKNDEAVVLTLELKPNG